MLLWELLPLDAEEAGFSSLEELLSVPEADVVPDEPEEVLELLPEPEEAEGPEELEELLDAAPLTVTSTLLLVTVQSL